MVLALNACGFQYILDKYPYTHPYPPPKTDVDEEVDNIDEPVPATDENTNESPHENFLRKPLNDKMWEDKNVITNCKNQHSLLQTPCFCIGSDLRQLSVHQAVRSDHYKRRNSITNSLKYQSWRTDEVTLCRALFTRQDTALAMDSIIAKCATNTKKGDESQAKTKCPDAKNDGQYRPQPMLEITRPPSTSPPGKVHGDGCQSIEVCIS
jgi:hypothetical protein